MTMMGPPLVHEARLATLILIGVWGEEDPERVRQVLIERLSQSQDILLLLGFLANLFTQGDEKLRMEGHKLFQILMDREIWA